MIRADWPFRPYIHRKIQYINGVPQRKAATVILFVKTPTGRFSKTKLYDVTCYAERQDNGTFLIDEKTLINKAISFAIRTAPKLPKDYSYTEPCVY